MKKILSYLLLLALGAGAARAFVYEDNFEMQADGDFDGNGLRDLIIVDKASGNYRIGYQLSPGVYTWVAARASGIANATGIGIGKINSTSYDSLAVTGPDANRVNLLDATSTSSAGLPVSFFPSSLGPNVCAVMDISGPTNTPLDDLYVCSVYNDPAVTAFRETLVRNNGSTNQTVLADNPNYNFRERANPVLMNTNKPARLALYERNSAPGQDAFAVFDLSGGTSAAILPGTYFSSPSAPQTWEYVTGQFISTNPYTQFLIYPQGDIYFYDFQVTEPTPGNYAFTSTGPFYFNSHPIGNLFVLSGTNGPSLLVLDTNGVTAVVYKFDGLNQPVPQQAFTAAAGQHFTGAGVLGNSGFMAYTAPLGQGTSANFQQYNWNGAGWIAGASGSLPKVSTYSASGNVMQFRYEPFVTNNPVLLRLNNAGDWSSHPVFAGLPPAITVSSESFLSSTQGLRNPVPLALGAAHPLANFGLANQYSNMISLFSFTPPAGDHISDVTISPAPGLYPDAVQLQFTAANPTDNIYFRIAGKSWTLWNSSMVVWVFTNTTVQYYGQPGAAGPKSAMKIAGYSFTQGPSTLDSNGDGIPDYVKLALGLDPKGGISYSGDGYSDLDKLVHGFNIYATNNVPTNYPHLDTHAVYDLNVTPWAWDGFTNAPMLCLTGTVLHAYDLQGDLLSEGLITNSSYLAAWLTNIVDLPENRLVSFATDRHYNIVTTNTDTTVGREMIGLAPVPTLQFPTVPYVYGGGNIFVEATNWIIAASNTYNNLSRTVYTNTLTVNNTLEALLFETEIAQLLEARGTNWWTNMTLFPFRPSDAGRTNPAQDTLLSLETPTTNQPAYNLQTMYAGISNIVENSTGLAVGSLRAVVRDIYRISSVYNNTNPATYALPPDEIRYFLWNGTLDTNYLPLATTTGQLPFAVTGATAILNSLQPRPSTNVLLVVRPDSIGGTCNILDLSGGGATFALIDSQSQPFAFPANFQLLPGALVQVVGYTDVPNPGCGYPAIEVTSILLASVPIATGPDSNGNLLVDSWENQFFGGLGVVDPFGDADGDGYSNLQEMLDGTDPQDPYSHVVSAPVKFSAPVLNFQAGGGQIQLHFNWPAAYVGRFNFGVQHAPDLSTPFTSLPILGPYNVSGDEFMVTFTVPATPQHYYYLAVSLAP